MSSDIVPLKAHGSAVSTLRTVASAEKFLRIFLRAAECEAGGLKDLSDDIADCKDFFRSWLLTLL